MLIWRNILAKSGRCARSRRHGEKILKPLGLTAQESGDLIAFLESVSDYQTNWRHNLPGDQTACD